MDAPALGQFLESEFRSLLGTVPRGKHVRPLTVMTIQDLENLEGSVNAFSFVRLLDDYAQECPDRVRSLHNFIAFSAYGPKILPSVHPSSKRRPELSMHSGESFFRTASQTPENLSHWSRCRQHALVDDLTEAGTSRSGDPQKRCNGRRAIANEQANRRRGLAFALLNSSLH